MVSVQTVLPFKLAVSDESLTAHSGLALVGEYLAAMGMGSLIDHELPGPGSSAGYAASAHVAPLDLMLTGGGRTRENLRIAHTAARGCSLFFNSTKCLAAMPQATGCGPHGCEGKRWPGGPASRQPQRVSPSSAARQTFGLYVGN